MLRLFLKIFFLLFVLKSTLNVAQNNNLAGVFLNADDFRSKRVTYTKNAGKKYTFHSNNIFSISFIKITIGDSVYKLKKDSLFGYRTKENVCYRVINKEEYEIINPTETILLYSKTCLTGYKSNQTIGYYFSLKANSEIFPLSIYYLKLVSKGDSLFHDQLDIYFRNDEDLLEYDNFNNIYKINKLKHK